MSDDQARRPGESFLAHRARLKAENQSTAKPPAAAKAAESTAATEEAPPRQLTDADMPPLDSLTADSDFGQFLAEGVSDALRRAALRKLFQLPEFGVLDGLNDYDEDYTQFEKLGEMVTYHQRRMRAREAAEKAAAEREAEVARQAVAPEQGEAAGEAVSPSETEAADASQGPDPGRAEDPVDDDGDLQA